VDPKLHVTGNATATAANVVANSDLVRMSVVAQAESIHNSRARLVPGEGDAQLDVGQGQVALVGAGEGAVGVQPLEGTDVRAS
jgi:hypothetical protein